MGVYVMFVMYPYIEKILHKFEFLIICYELNTILW